MPEYGMDVEGKFFPAEITVTADVPDNELPRFWSQAEWTKTAIFEIPVGFKKDFEQGRLSIEFEGRLFSPVTNSFYPGSTKYVYRQVPCFKIESSI